MACKSVSSAHNRALEKLTKNLLKRLFRKKIKSKSKPLNQKKKNNNNFVSRSGTGLWSLFLKIPGDFDAKRPKTQSSDIAQ